METVNIIKEKLQKNFDEYMRNTDSTINGINIEELAVKYALTKVDFRPVNYDVCKTLAAVSNPLNWLYDLYKVNNFYHIEKVMNDFVNTITPNQIWDLDQLMD